MLHSPEKLFDVLGLGCTAVDDVVCVPSFPAADQKVRVERSFRRSGGLTGAALVTAARLGARCAYAGRLGMDEPSQYIAEDFRREGVDVTHVPRSARACVVHSTIIVGEAAGSRNIFFEVKGLLGAHDSLPATRIIRASRVLFIDHYGMKGNLRAARIARSAGVGIVADFEGDAIPLFQEVLDLVDHLILSEGFALRITRETTAARAAQALWRADRAAVIVTCGAEGCWSVSATSGNEAVHYPAFRVRAADTTGCGDVFHGAYAASLARGNALPTRIRFAAAAAALKAMSGEIPHLGAVNRFVRTETGRRNAQTPAGASRPARATASSKSL
jgi:sugar/nucleoside kinase (ribokinase family)